MNKGIYKQLIAILFLGFLSTYAGEIKAEESCNYSTRKEYKRCKKEGVNSIPKYPIENFHADASPMVENISSVNNSAIGEIYEVFEFKAYEKDKLQVSSGTKSVGFMYGLSWRNNWINKTTFDINTQRIISLKKYDIPSRSKALLFRKYNLKYIDNYGEVKSIKFDQILFKNKNTVFDMIGDYLLYVSNLKWGEEISAESKIEKILKENEKFLNITKGLIFESNNSPSKCFIAKDSKYPELSARYRELYGTINTFRAKLDLPPSTDLKPICN
tara:strand:- start:70 stop:885 length:816 start_codon:yes stop_codon:yes gene_type:complete